jgi:hypothetical protein
MHYKKKHCFIYNTKEEGTSLSVLLHDVTKFLVLSRVLLIYTTFIAIFHSASHRVFLYRKVQGNRIET